ncbi:MAG: hypothetical protein K2M95_00710, partial [Clostridiales bacterium]|nr:hypothetical protein [Clostridiales bacterium]
MIALVFSYKRSAALLLALIAAGAAGIVCVCLFVPAVLDLVLYIASICVCLIAGTLICYALASHLLRKQIYALLSADTPKALQDRMRRLTRRAVAGGVKGALSLEYAYALLYDGKWKEALTAASDAMVFAGDKAKPAAYVCLCGAYFGLGEKELFDTFYERVESHLKSVRNQTPKTSDALASLVAMHHCFDGEEKR